MAKTRRSIIKEPITRRQAIKTMGGALAAGLASQAFPTLLFAKEKKPNIVFILSDDHRWDCLSCMGHPFIKTPNMDRLANQGVLFENAFVTTSLCSPSRASFLTGQYAHTHGVKNNITTWKDSNVTLLEILKEAGYDTAFIGKWHMPGHLPHLRGVDEFITFTIQQGQGRYFDCPLIINGVETPRPGKYITEDLTDFALEFISRKRDNPFCLYLSHKAVHHQFLPPPELKGLYKDVKLHLPKEADPWCTWVDGAIWYGTIGKLDYLYRRYCETIVALDQQIGRLVKRLDQLGLSDNTVIIYTTDNGYFWGEHHLVDKRWPYEESIRIPFIVRYPGHIKNPGRRIPNMVLNIDVAPTLLDLAGVDIPKNMEGISIKPVLNNSRIAWRKAWLYEYFEDYPYQVPEMNGIRTDKYKYIEYSGKKPAELFDLANDPHEYHNIIETPEGMKRLPELKKMLAQLKQGVRL